MQALQRQNSSLNRLKRITSIKCVELALQGGGAHGAYT